MIPEEELLEMTGSEVVIGDNVENKLVDEYVELLNPLEEYIDEEAPEESGSDVVIGDIVENKLVDGVAVDVLDSGVI